MKPSRSQRFALGSVVLLLAAAATAATRPHYGGVLRIGMAERVSILDPAQHEDERTTEIARLRITPLLFETLVREDSDGTLHPALARTWTASANLRHWQFWLRRAVTFHDGTPLTTELAAKALAGLMADCAMRSAGEMLMVECQTPHPALAAELAMPARAIVRRGTAGALEGTGPFLLSQWQPRERLVLSAWEGYWGGRPYVDTVEITLGQSHRDQVLALQLGRSDIVEVPAGEASRIDLGSDARIGTTLPLELMVLVFSRQSKAVADARVREGMSQSIDRVAIAAKLLQHEADPASSLAPNWMSGYAASFSAAGDKAHARQLLTDARQPSGAPLPTITLQYESGDPLAKLVAERIAVDARDAGLTVQTSGADSRTVKGDVILQHLSLDSLDPAAMLAQVAEELRTSLPAIADDALESVYRAEQAMLSERWLVPVVFVKRSWAAAGRVRNWKLPPDGRWRADELWLEEEHK